MSHRESLHSNMVPTAIGLSHSLGHKLGASYSISHGQCSVFTLSPSVLLLSRTLPLGSWGLTSLSAALSAIPSSFLPTDLDEGVPSEIGENEERRNAWKVGMAVDTLVKEIGLGGKKLRDYKVGEDNLMGIAEAATKSLKDWEGVPEAKVVVHEVLKKIF
jgi:alcohol dehydrogenase class IV